MSKIKSREDEQIADLKKKVAAARKASYAAEKDLKTEQRIAAKAYNAAVGDLERMACNAEGAYFAVKHKLYQAVVRKAQKAKKTQEGGTCSKCRCKCGA
jgi:hypothetical protein